MKFFQIINIKNFIDSSDECYASDNEWRPYNNKNDALIETCNNENIVGVVNVNKNIENKKTGEMIIKSVINYIIDQCCDQSKDTLLEALDETVNSESKKLVRWMLDELGDASKWKNKYYF